MLRDGDNPRVRRSILLDAVPKTPLENYAFDGKVKFPPRNFLELTNTAGKPIGNPKIWPNVMVDVKGIAGYRVFNLNGETLVGLGVSGILEYIVIPYKEFMEKKVSEKLHQLHVTGEGDRNRFTYPYVSKPLLLMVNPITSLRLLTIKESAGDGWVSNMSAVIEQEVIQAVQFRRNEGSCKMSFEILERSGRMAFFEMDGSNEDHSRDIAKAILNEDSYTPFFALNFLIDRQLNEVGLEAKSNE